MKKIFFVILTLSALVALASCQHTHMWSDWEVDTAPTCTEDGTKVRRCECGDTQTSTLYKTHTRDHNYCGETQVCTVCGEEQINQETHSLDSATGTCRNCGKVRFDIEISLPEEGRTFYEYTDKNDVLYAFHVDNVDCTAGTSNVTIMLSGTKTECLYGNDYLAACKVIYKLFDSEGYVVASGYIDTIRLTVGDSVRNAKITLSGLDEWESYILELYDIYPIPSTTTE